MVLRYSDWLNIVQTVVFQDKFILLHLITYCLGKGQGSKRVEVRNGTWPLLLLTPSSANYPCRLLLLPPLPPSSSTRLLSTTSEVGCGPVWSQCVLDHLDHTSEVVWNLPPLPIQVCTFLRHCLISIQSCQNAFFFFFLPDGEVAQRSRNGTQTHLVYKHFHV